MNNDWGIFKNCEIVVCIFSTEKFLFSTNDFPQFKKRLIFLDVIETLLVS